MAKMQFHPLQISHIRPQTAGGIALKFDVPEALQADFAFAPGQYLTLRSTINGQDIRRSYSICSAENDNGLEVGIKRVDGGVFSNHAFGLSVGDTLSVMPPQGRFTARIGGTHNYLLLAAGSGITPCLSIAKSVLAGEPDSSITLIYGNSATDSVMFRDDIEALKDRYTERFTLTHVMSREHQDVECLNGRLDGTRIMALHERGLVDTTAFDDIYICGPQPIIESCSAALGDLGIADDKIHFELFTPADGKSTAARQTVPDVVSGASVEIILDGTRRTIKVDGALQTVLKAAQKAGLDLPFSCAGGMCCTCRCRIVSGEAAMDVNYSLQDWEVEAGFTLACQTRPKTDKLVIDFDAQ